MPNRITAATSDIPIKDLPALRKRLTKTEFSAVEAAPAFVDAYDRSPNRAVALARGYAATLKTTEDHRQLFQVVAGLDDTHRRALIKGYREEGQGRGVVQAISLLPRTQGRAVMESLVLKDRRQGRQAGRQGGGQLAARRRRRDAGPRHGPAQPRRRRRRGRVLRGRGRRDLGCRERGRRRPRGDRSRPSSTPSPTSSTGPSRPSRTSPTRSTPPPRPSPSWSASSPRRPSRCSRRCSTASSRSASRCATSSWPPSSSRSR